MKKLYKRIFINLLKLFIIALYGSILINLVRFKQDILSQYDIAIKIGYLAGIVLSCILLLKPNYDLYVLDQYNVSKKKLFGLKVLYSLLSDILVLIVELITLIVYNKIFEGKFPNFTHATIELDIYELFLIEVLSYLLFKAAFSLVFVNKLLYKLAPIFRLVAFISGFLLLLFDKLIIDAICNGKLLLVSLVTASIILVFWLLHVLFYFKSKDSDLFI